MIGGIDRVPGRREKDLHSGLRAEPAIALEVAGITAQILLGPELGWVDEQAEHDTIGLRPRPANQREVAFVQKAHGGNKPDFFFFAK